MPGFFVLNDMLERLTGPFDRVADLRPKPHHRVHPRFWQAHHQQAARGPGEGSAFGVFSAQRRRRKAARAVEPLERPIGQRDHFGLGRACAVKPHFLVDEHGRAAGFWQLQQLQRKGV